MSPFHTAPFRQHGSNTTISGTTTSSGGQLARAKDQTAVVLNIGSVVSFVKFGQGSLPTATANDIPIEPNGKRVFQLLEADTHVAAITASGTATVYVSVGDGPTT